MANCFGLLSVDNGFPLNALHFATLYDEEHVSPASVELSRERPQCRRPLGHLRHESLALSGVESIGAIEQDQPVACLSAAGNRAHTNECKNREEVSQLGLLTVSPGS